MTLKNQTRRYLPVETIEEIIIMGNAELDKSLIELLSEKGIVLHFFDYYGYYTGTYYPPESRNSGQVLLAQAAHWLNEAKRVELAAAFVIGAIGNMIRLVNYYQRRLKYRILSNICGYASNMLRKLKTFRA